MTFLGHIISISFYYLTCSFSLYFQINAAEWTVQDLKGIQTCNETCKCVQVKYSLAINRHLHLSTYWSLVNPLITHQSIDHSSIHWSLINPLITHQSIDHSSIHWSLINPLITHQSIDHSSIRHMVYIYVQHSDTQLSGADNQKCTNNISASFSLWFLYRNYIILCSYLKCYRFFLYRRNVSESLFIQTKCIWEFVLVKTYDTPSCVWVFTGM